MNKSASNMHPIDGRRLCTSVAYLPEVGQGRAEDSREGGGKERRGRRKEGAGREEVAQRMDGPLVLGLGVSRELEGTGQEVDDGGGRGGAGECTREGARGSAGGGMGEVAFPEPPLEEDLLGWGARGQQEGGVEAVIRRSTEGEGRSGQASKRARFRF